jgi:signal transduction histidine kinase
LSDESPYGKFPPRLVFADSDDNLWIAYDGVGLVKRKDNLDKLYTARDGLPGSRVQFLFQASSGQLWVGTETGFALFVENRFQRIGKKEGLGGDIVTSMAEAPDGSFYLTTNEGLSRIKGTQITNFMTGNGLPEGRLYKIIVNKDGDLWISSSKGIYRISSSDIKNLEKSRSHVLRPVIYGVPEGLVTTTFTGAGWKTHDGSLWFGTVKGTVVVPPLVPANSIPPKVYVEEIITRGGQKYNGQNALIPAGKGDIEIHYTGLSLLVPEKVRFRYKLLGFDQEWIDPGSRRVALYTNLPPGRFSFVVQASNNDGIWNGSGDKIDFSIRPYFYQTYWFYTLCILALLISIFGLMRLRTQAARKRFQMVLDERSRVAREIHDTLLQGFVGVVFQLEAVTDIVLKSPKAAYEHLNRIIDISNSSVDEARQAIWDLRSQPIDYSGVAEALKKMANELAAGTPMKVSVVVTDSDQSLSPSLEKNILRIGREAITNSVRHSGASNLLVSLKCERYTLKLRVEDDGCGFEPGTNGSSGKHFGLIGMVERARSTGGTLKVESKPGRGTVIEAIVPLLR